MFYSGLVVACAPADFQTVEAALRAFEGIEVHQTDPASGRFVVVIEAPSIDAETERFEALRRMEHVVDVSLIVHRQEDDEPGAA